MSGLLGKVIGGLTGGLVGVIGANQVSQRAKGNRGAINRAYTAATLQQNLDQANTRENTNESLNARGMLAAGAPTAGAALSPIAQGVAKSGAYRNFYNGAQQGSVGASNTVGGQVNANLGDQFYKEKKSIYDEQQTDLNQNKAAATNGYIQNAVNGIETAGNIMSGNAAGAAAGVVNGMSGGSAGAPMTGAFGMPVNLGPSGAVGTPVPSAATGDMMGTAQTSVPDTGPTGTGAISKAATMVGDSNTSNANFNVG
jgi:hypothetical protein